MKTIIWFFVALFFVRCTVPYACQRIYAGQTSEEPMDVGGWVVTRNAEPALLVTRWCERGDMTLVTTRGGVELDRLVLPRLRRSQMLLAGFDCSENGQIDADVFGVGLERYASERQNLLRAWRINTETGKFLEISPHGMACSAEWNQE